MPLDQINAALSQLNTDLATLDAASTQEQTTSAALAEAQTAQATAAGSEATSLTAVQADLASVQQLIQQQYGVSAAPQSSAAALAIGDHPALQQFFQQLLQAVGPALAQFLLNLLKSETGFVRILDFGLLSLDPDPLQTTRPKMHPIQSNIGNQKSKSRRAMRPRPAAVLLPVCCLLSTVYSLPAQTPASELRAAVEDVERLPPKVRGNVRYLSLYAIAAQSRAETARVANYVVNALSRTRAITPLRQVGQTLLRIDATAYTASAGELDEWTTAWGSLVQTDPYWHIQTEVLVAGESKSENPKSQIVTVDGGWVGLDQAARLRAATGSQGAILRADYFIARATSTPAYYQFVGIPAKEADFLKSLGVDPNVIANLRADAGANLFISGITKKPRRIVWSQGPLGGVYQTLDVQQVDAARDPIRRAISTSGFDLKFDAGEWFAMPPNGLWRTALYDSQGNLQQSVPDKIAKDDSDPAADGIVTPMISCIRCHQESGLRPFRDDQSRLLASGRVDLRSYDPRIVQRAAEFYDEPRLQRQMAFDRDTYALAVARATGGMKPPELAEALARAVRAFAYQPVTLAQAARELGLRETELAGVLGGSHDPILLALLEGRSVLRGQWESSFAEAAIGGQGAGARDQGPGVSRKGEP